jgi:hypothetical protein
MCGRAVTLGQNSTFRLPPHINIINKPPETGASDAGSVCGSIAGSRENHGGLDGEFCSWRSES